MKTANEYLDIVRFLDDLTVEELRHLFKKELAHCKGEKLDTASKIIGYLLSNYSFDDLQQIIDDFAENFGKKFQPEIGDIIYVGGGNEPYLFIGALENGELAVTLNKNLDLWFYAPNKADVEYSGCHLEVRDLKKAIAVMEKGGHDVRK